MLDSIYPMTFELLRNHIFGVKKLRFCHYERIVVMSVIT